MFLELIATFTAGFGCAGIAMLVRKLSGGRLPGWMTPVAASVGMLAFAIFSEYAWYGRTVANLPDGVVVAASTADSQFYRPWTYVAPIITRFAAIDSGSIRTHPAYPQQRMVDLYLLGRWSPNHKITVVFDCDAARRADLVEGATLTESGSVEGAAWVSLAPDDPVLRTTCERGTG